MELGTPAVTFRALVDSCSNLSILCRSGISMIGVPTMVCFTSPANRLIAWAVLIFGRRSSYGSAAVADKVASRCEVGLSWPIS